MPRDPFESCLPVSTSAELVKNLERRWGLSIVTFLPGSIYEKYAATRREIPGLWGAEEASADREGRAYIEFPDPEQLHCTHLTLRRSDPEGPIESGAFIKHRHSLRDVFEAIAGVARRSKPFEVTFDRLRIGHNGLGIIALGQCADATSVEVRTRLIRELIERLEELCHLSTREWDEDASRYRAVHSAWGVLKRPPPNGYESFTKWLEGMRIDVRCTFEEISLVHHRHRSLLFPQQGCVTFPLGGEPAVAAEDFPEALNLL